MWEHESHLVGAFQYSIQRFTRSSRTPCDHFSPVWGSSPCHLGRVLKPFLANLSLFTQLILLSHGTSSWSSLSPCQYTYPSSWFTSVFNRSSSCTCRWPCLRAISMGTMVDTFPLRTALWASTNPSGSLNILGVVRLVHSLSEEPLHNRLVTRRGWFDEEKHSTGMGLVLFLSKLEALVQVLCTLDYQLANVEVIIVTSGGHESSVEAIGFKLVRVVLQKLCQLIAIIFHFSDDFLKGMDE